MTNMIRTILRLTGPADCRQHFYGALTANYGDQNLRLDLNWIKPIFGGEKELGEFAPGSDRDKHEAVRASEWGCIDNTLDAAWKETGFWSSLTFWTPWHPPVKAFEVLAQKNYIRHLTIDIAAVSTEEPAQAWLGHMETGKFYLTETSLNDPKVAELFLDGNPDIARLVARDKKLASMMIG